MTPFLYAFLAAFFTHAASSNERSNGLLTPNFGIVTRDDLAYDAQKRVIAPYDPNVDSASLYWQCFQKNKITASYESWRGHDGMGPSNKMYSMCTIEIRVRDHEDLHIYVGRRGYRLEICRDFIRSWKRITKGQDIICLNGEGGGYYQDEKDGRYKLWTWVKTKTKLGCDAYFPDDCNTDGCADKKRN